MCPVADPVSMGALACLRERKVFLSETKEGGEVLRNPFQPIESPVQSGLGSAEATFRDKGHGTKVIFLIFTFNRNINCQQWTKKDQLEDFCCTAASGQLSITDFSH